MSALHRLRRIWFWIEGHGLVIVLVIAAFVGIGTPLLLRAEAQHRQEQICTFAERSQRSDRLLIDTALDDPGGGSGPAILQPKSFAELPESVKTYLRELASGTPAPTDADDGDTLAERLQRFRDEQLGSDDLPDYCGGHP